MPNPLIPTEMNFPLQGYPGQSDDEINGPKHKENSDIDSDADIDPIYYVCVNMQYHDHLVEIEKAYHEKLDSQNVPLMAEKDTQTAPFGDLSKDAQT